jgi:hypothetical protein
MRNVEVCAILLTVHILCAAGSWMNVKNLLSIYSYGCEIARWQYCTCLVEFPVTVEMDDGN